MSYRLEWTDQAQDDYSAWQRSGNKTGLRKIATLLDELREHPYTGTGQVERMRYYPTNRWSRRIDKQNRIEYEVYDGLVVVKLFSLLGHYGDK